MGVSKPRQWRYLLIHKAEMDKQQIWFQGPGFTRMYMASARDSGGIMHDCDKEAPSLKGAGGVILHTYTFALLLS